MLRSPILNRLATAAVNWSMVTSFRQVNYYGRTEATMPHHCSWFVRNQSLQLGCRSLRLCLLRTARSCSALLRRRRHNRQTPWVHAVSEVVMNYCPLQLQKLTSISFLWHLLCQSVLLCIRVSPTVTQRHSFKKMPSNSVRTPLLGWTVQTILVCVAAPCHSQLDLSTAKHSKDYSSLQFSHDHQNGHDLATRHLPHHRHPCRNRPGGCPLCQTMSWPNQRSPGLHCASRLFALLSLLVAHLRLVVAWSCWVGCDDLCSKCSTIQA